VIIGAGEMRHQRQGADRRRPSQAPDDPGKCCRFDTEPAHAGIDLEPAGHGVPDHRRLEQLHLLVRVDHHVEGQLGSRADLCRRDAATEDDEALANAGFAQLDRLLDPGNRERVGVLENSGDLDQAVAVGVRLDDREHGTARGQFPDPAEVAAQRCGPDHRNGGWGH
jgi:hypothetical protein